MRKRLASLLHRWAYRIDPPRMTVDHSVSIGDANELISDAIRATRAEAERRESRGWNN